MATQTNKNSPCYVPRKPKHVLLRLSIASQPHNQITSTLYDTKEYISQYSHFSRRPEPFSNASSVAFRDFRLRTTIILEFFKSQHSATRETHPKHSNLRLASLSSPSPWLSTPGEIKCSLHQHHSSQHHSSQHQNSNTTNLLYSNITILQRHATSFLINLLLRQ